MNFEVFGCKIYISVPFTAFIALMFLFDRTGTMGLSLAGAALHEAGHIVAMKLLGTMPKRIELRPAVVNIVKPQRAVSLADDIKILLAGPTAGMLAAAAATAIYLFSAGRMWLCFAAVNATLTFFNLLPVSELDGGRILENILILKFSSDTAEKVMTAVSCIFTALVTAVGAAVAWSRRGSAALLICGIYLLMLTLLKLKS